MAERASNNRLDVLLGMSMDAIIREYAAHKSPLVSCLVARLEEAHNRAESAKNKTNLAYASGYSAGHAEGYTRGYAAGCSQTAARIHANLHDSEEEGRGYY